MSSQGDYDSLTKEQREVRDKEDRAREAAEQASASISLGLNLINRPPY